MGKKYATPAAKPQKRALALAAAYFLAGGLLIWLARSDAFIAEEGLKIQVPCGWLSSAPYSELLMSRETGEDGAYYRPLENALLGTLARNYSCGSDAPYRLAAGIIWLLCAASIVPPLLRTGAPPAAAWCAAALLMAHPYNSFCFISPVAACNTLLIPAAAGAWLAFSAAESGLLYCFLSALCVYAGCLSRENAVLIPVALATVAARQGFSRRRLIALAACGAAVGLYLLQRHFALAHDRPPHPGAMQWAMLRYAGAAYSKYLGILVTGSFRAMGGMAASPLYALHLALWAAAAAAAVFLSAPRRTALVWLALFALCGGEIAASLTMNGEIMPTRAISSFALALIGLCLIARDRPQYLRQMAAAACAVGLFWFIQSARHVYASRDEWSFLEIHSNPPYSWKVEAERAPSLLRQGQPQLALEAASASEKMRPGWLSSALRAAVQSMYFTHNTDELKRLASSGDNEGAAHIGYVNIGTALGKAGAWPEATACFTKAARLAPLYGPAWMQLSWASSSVGDWQAAKAAAEKAVALNGADANGWQNLGYSLLMLRDWKKSADAYRRLYELSPMRPGVAVFRAFALERSGQTEQALDALSAAPDAGANPLIVAYAARLAKKPGRTSSARPSPETAAQLQSLFDRIMSGRP
ncbi:MAG: hypothetical protein WC421_10000 [Elusimicrobiales bacterium]